MALEIGGQADLGGGGHERSLWQWPDVIKDTPFTIGHENGLSEIALANKDGKYHTSLEAGASGIGAAATAASAANVMPSSPTADLGAVPLHNQAGPNTWLIVAISYVYLRQDQKTAGDIDCLLKAFLGYIISDEGQGLLPAYGAVGVPAQAKSIAQAAIDGLTMPVCQAWSFEGGRTLGGCPGKPRHFAEGCW